ncbi:MAG: PaaI family thioesterase [Tissierellia bacterium]|nr:PaaI family thioesterase [Tissierellia bacterium]
MKTERATLGSPIDEVTKKHLQDVLMNLRFENPILAEAEVGRAVVEIELSQPLMNGMGITHGGMLFTLMDMAAGSAVRSLGVTSVTLQSSINYIRATKEGRLRAEGQVIHPGRSTVVVHVKATDSNGKLVADANFTMYVMDK